MFPAFLLFLLTAVIAYILLSPRRNPAIPRIPLREYLPSGLMRSLTTDPPTFRRTLRAVASRYGSIFYVWLGWEYVLLTANPRDIAHAAASDSFRRPDMILRVFASLAPSGLIAMPRDLHKAVRGTLRRDFSAEGLYAFHHKMNSATEELVGTLRKLADVKRADGAPVAVDITKVLALTTFEVLTGIAFGSSMSLERRKEFAQTVDDVFEEFMKEMLGYPFRQWMTFLGVRKRFFECKDKMYQLCNIFIAERLAESAEQRKQRPGDMLDVFLGLESADPNLVPSLVVETAMGGSHAVNQVLAWSIYEICCNQDVALKMEDEIQRIAGAKPINEALSVGEVQQLCYVRNVWKETLRLHSPANVVTRIANRAVTLKGSGAKVGAGDKVVLFVPCTHVDAGVWNEAHKFRPERWGVAGSPGEGGRGAEQAYFPYGAGKVSCAGKALAEYEGPVVLAEMVRRFRFSLACGADEVVSCSGLVETARYCSGEDGTLDMGVPVFVECRACLS